MGTRAYSLELTCGKCGKSYRVTKFATPPSTGQTDEEPRNEVLSVIRQTVWLTHSHEDKCDGKITDIEIP